MHKRKTLKSSARGFYCSSKNLKSFIDNMTQDLTNNKVYDVNLQ